MNKIIVSILFALVLIFGINKIADIAFHIDKPEKSAYLVATTSASDSTSSTTSNTDETRPENILVLLTSANISGGEKVFKKCVHPAFILVWNWDTNFQWMYCFSMRYRLTASTQSGMRIPVICSAFWLSSAEYIGLFATDG